MKTGLLRQSRRTAVLFWVMTGLFVAQMSWWIIFQLWRGPDDLQYRRQALESERTLALYRWGEYIGAWADSLQNAWKPVTTVSSTSLNLADLQGFHEIYYEDVGGRQLVERNSETTTPIGRIAIPAAGGEVAIILDASALHTFLACEYPNILCSPIADTLKSPRGAVTLSQLSIDPEALERVVDSRRRRVRMFAGEGSFFLLLIIVGAFAIHRSLRRGAEFERRQQNFLAAVTHELKAPLASIRLFTETLSSRQLSEEKQRECLGKIAEDVERLQELIDDALEAGVFSRRSFHPSLELNDLSDDLHSYVDMYRHRAERAGLTLTTEIAPGVKVCTDQNHLRRAVGVVIENAIKYSRTDATDSNIHITLASQNREAVITVADGGVGLEAAEQKRVFERFYRAGDELTRSTSGSGLGLYLAREIIAAHRGRIRLYSDGLGTGATVEIRLPLARQG